MVLSQFCTFTLVKPISSISPSTSYFGMAIQSPVLNMRLAAICIPATKPKIVSLNINNSTAAIAVRPDTISNGLLSTIKEILSSIVMIAKASLVT